MYYKIADLNINPDMQTVHRGAEKIDLPDLSFKVFIEILKAAPQPIDVASLSASAWYSAHVSDETVAQRITLLRRRLGDDSKAPKYIKTVRGAGYVAASPVRHGSSAEKSKKALYAALACSLVLLLVTVAIFFPRGENQVEPARPSATQLLVERAQDQLQVQQADATDRAIHLLREALQLEADYQPAKLGLSFALSTRSTKFCA